MGGGGRRATQIPQKKGNKLEKPKKQWLLQLRNRLQHDVKLSTTNVLAASNLIARILFYSYLLTFKRKRKKTINFDPVNSQVNFTLHFPLASFTPWIVSVRIDVSELSARSFDVSFIRGKDNNFFLFFNLPILTSCCCAFRFWKGEKPHTQNMARHFYAVIRLCWLFLACTTATGISFEESVKQLSKNYVRKRNPFPVSVELI